MHLLGAVHGLENTLAVWSMFTPFFTLHALKKHPPSSCKYRHMSTDCSYWDNLGLTAASRKNTVAPPHDRNTLAMVHHYVSQNYINYLRDCWVTFLWPLITFDGCSAYIMKEVTFCSLGGCIRPFVAGFPYKSFARVIHIYEKEKEKKSTEQD